jgi:hypothetical protein
VATHLAINSGGEIASSLEERRKEQKLQMLPKPSLNTRASQHLALLSPVSTAGQEKEKTRNTTRATMATFFF